MGRPTAIILVQMLRDFLIASMPEIWLVWTEEEKKAIISLHDKAASYAGMTSFDQWVQDLTAQEVVEKLEVIEHEDESA